MILFSYLVSTSLFMLSAIEHEEFVTITIIIIIIIIIIINTIIIIIIIVIIIIIIIIISSIIIITWIWKIFKVIVIFVAKMGK